MQRQLMKRGSVQTNETPYKDFDNDFNLVLQLLRSHQIDNPKCNVQESEWDTGIQQLLTAFESLPSIIVNSVYQPNIDSNRSPFAPKGRGESIKRNLFKSPKVQVRERAVEAAESAESAENIENLDDNEDSESDEGPSKSLSKEMIDFKQRLLETASVEAKRSGARKKVVDFFKKNLHVLNHYSCLLCGYQTPWRKNLYRHYNNASNCRTPALSTKITKKKGSVSSRPVVIKERVAVDSAQHQSDHEEPIAGPSGVRRERELVRSAEDKVVEREEVQSAETQEDQVVNTSINEEDTETNSILSDLNSYHQEIDDSDLIPRVHERERDEEEECIDEEVSETTNTKKVMKIFFNSDDESIYEFENASMLQSSNHQHVEEDTVLEDVVLEPGLSPITKVDHEPEKRNILESEGEADNEINPPNFIAIQIPEWKMGDDLQDKLRSILFSKDPRLLYDVKDQLLSSLAMVQPDYQTQHVPTEYMIAFEQACGASTESETQEILSKLKDFTKYVSPDNPTGRIGLRNDYQYIWMSNKRIRGKGKSKKPETIIQYCRILFGHGSISLYNFVESRGKKLEDFLFPQEFSSSSSILVEWANQQPNPSTQSKKILNIRGNFMIDIRLYFIFLGMRHNALGTLYDYFWEKADKFPVNITDVHMIAQRVEYQRNQISAYHDASNRSNELRPYVQKSARIAQQLAENIRPNRYESISEEIKSYFKTAQYAALTKEIKEATELTKEQFQRISTQLMMICILTNGHRAQIGTFFKRKDLYTLKRHSLLPDKFVIELDK